MGLEGYCHDCDDCRDLRNAPANLVMNLETVRAQTPEPPLTPCLKHAVEASPDSSPTESSSSSSHEDAESATSVTFAYAQEVVAVADQVDTSAADALFMIDELARHRVRDTRLGFERSLADEQIETLTLFNKVEQGHLRGGHLVNQRGRFVDYDTTNLLQAINGLVLRRIYAQQSGAPRDEQADVTEALGMMKALEKHHYFVSGKKMDFVTDILGCAAPPQGPTPERRGRARTAIDNVKKLIGHRFKTSSTSSTLVNEPAREPNVAVPGLLDLYLQSHNANTGSIMAPPGLLDAYLQSVNANNQPAYVHASQSQVQELHEIRERALARNTQSRQEFAQYATLASAIQGIQGEATLSQEEDDLHDQQLGHTSKPSKLSKFFGEPAAVVSSAVAGVSAFSQRVSAHHNPSQHQSTQSCSTRRFELESYGLSGGIRDSIPTVYTTAPVVDNTEAAPEVAIMSSTNAILGSNSSDHIEHHSHPRLKNATSNSRIAEHNARILETSRGQQHLAVPNTARYSSSASYYTDEGSEWRESAFIAPLSLTRAAAATYDAYNAERGNAAVAPPPGIPYLHFDSHHARYDSQGQLQHAAVGTGFSQGGRNVPAVPTSQATTMSQFDHVDTTTQPRFMPQVGQFRNRSPSPVRQPENFVSNLTEIGQSMMFQTMTQQQAMVEQQRQLFLQIQHQSQSHMQAQMQIQMQQMQQVMDDQLAQMQARMRETTTHSENYASAHYEAISAEKEAEIMALTADIAHLQAENARARADAGMANAEAEFVRSTSNSYPNVQLQPAPAGRRGRSMSPQRLAFRGPHTFTNSSPIRRPAGHSNAVLPSTTFEGMHAYNKRRAAAGLPRWGPVISAPPTPSWAGSANWADYAYGVDYPTDEE